MHLDSLPFTFDKMIEALKDKKNFSLSRWGDGEFMCMLKYEGRNTDKHEYYPTLGAALRKIIRIGGKGEMFGLQSLALKDLAHHPEFEAWVQSNTWSANAEILARNHARDEEFFNAVGNRDVILVGNGYLRDVPFVVKDFIEIPLENCWLEHEYVLQEIQTHKNCVILYCASMMANVLINELHSPHYTQIDVGSFLDPYVGRLTRNYHHDLNL